MDRICQKMPFANSAEAREFIKSRKLFKTKSGKKVRVYYCYICEMYHQTTLSKNQSKRISKRNKRNAS